MLTFEFVPLRSSFHPIKMSSRASDFLAFFIIFAFLLLCALLSRSRQTADLFFFCIVFGASASFHDAVRFLFFCAISSLYLFRFVPANARNRAYSACLAALF